MEWITPKTNWKPSDYINYEDVNRIVNNLAFLKRFSYSLFVVPYEKMTYKATDYTDIPYADELNAIENNLESLNINTYSLQIGTKQTFEQNGIGWNYIELNRIESAMIRLYDKIKQGRIPLTMMEFTFGKQGGFRA